MNSNYCYDVSDWQRACSKLQMIREGSQREVIRSGEVKLGGWRQLHDEVFHRLYSEVEQPVAEEHRAEGYEPYSTIHEEIGNLREFGDLRAQCQNDDWLSARAAAALEDEILAGGLADVDNVQDARGDAETIDALKAMLEDIPEDSRQEYEEGIAEAEEVLAQKRTAAQEASAAIDPTSLRNAIRAGLRAAQEAVREANELVDGLGFDDSAHSTKAGRRVLGQKLSTLVANNPRLKRIAALAGRLRRIADRERSKQPKRGSGVLTGVETGDDLAAMLPSELAFAFGKTLPIFATKFLQRSAFQYKYSPPPPKEAGPIVICLDSSGSMSGEPSEWAAAVALAFIHVAAKDKRPVALVHFGSTVLRCDEFDGKSLDPEKVIEAVSFFASDGGTEFEPPLDMAARFIEKTKTFQFADIVFVTDGYGPISEGFRDVYMRWKKERTVRLYSILVGGAAQYIDGESFKPLKELSNEMVAVADALRDDTAIHSLLGKASAK